MGKHKKWTVTDDDNLIKCINLNMTWHAIGEHLGCNSWQAERRAKELNLGHKVPFAENPVTVGFTIPESFDKKLQALADAEGITKAWFIRKFLMNNIQ